jgi:hypothetical protein
MISGWIDVLGDLDNIVLFQILILGKECIPHCTFREGIFSNLNLGVNLTLFEEGFLPVDLHVLIFDDEPCMAN